MIAIGRGHAAAGVAPRKLDAGLALDARLAQGGTQQGDPEERGETQREEHSPH